MRKILLLLTLAILAGMASGQRPYSYRYWIDNDLGSVVSGGGTGETQFSADLSAVGSGLHALHVQARNSSGVWSSTHTRYFMKNEQSVATTARYWLDSDMKTLHNNVATSGVIELDLSALSAGLHAVHYQTVAADGIPSAVHTRFFMKNEQSVATTARYWLDNDMNTLHTNVATSGVIELDLSALSAGLHAVHYQTVAADGIPSAVHTRFFMKNEQSVATTARYWLDSDMKTLHNNVATSGVIELDLSVLSPGLHAVHYQTVAANGIPSAVRTRYFYYAGQPTNYTARIWIDDNEASAKSYAVNNELIEIDLGELEGEHLLHVVIYDEQEHIVDEQTQTFTVTSSNVLTYIFNTDNKTAAVTGITEDYTGAVIIPSNVIHDGETYTVTEIDRNAFYDCTGLTSITIPNSVTSIGSYAFSWCSGLTSVTIGNSVTSIGEFAFSSCSGLTSVTIPNSVTSIGECAFCDCKGLTSVNIPNSVTSIGEFAFLGCSSLTSVTVPNSVTYIGSGAFAACSNLAIISVDAGNTVYNSPDGSNAIIETTSNKLVAGCKNTTISNSVTSIGENAFDGCSGLTSVTIPSSVTSIESYAFFECTGLTSVTIPNSVTYIGSGAFAACSNLATITVDAGNTIYISPDDSNAIIETISNKLVAGCKNTTIPNSVTSIGDWAFYGCSGLTSVTIPNNVTSIGFRAFSDCTGLTSVTIPNSVMSIGYYAFSGCDGLTSVTSLICTPISLNENTFSNYNIPLYVPSENVEAYRAMKPWNEFKEIIPIYLTPIEKEVDYSGESSTVDENTDLGGTVIDNVYYNISSDNGGFNADGKCLVVNKAMSDDEVEEVCGKDLFSDEVKEYFTGIVIMVPAGKGKVVISAQTTGGMTLMVKVGSADPIEMELEGKLKMKFPYDVTEPTYVYIYAGQNAAARTRAAEEPSLKIYGISLEMDILKGDANGDGVVNDADMKDVTNYIMGKTPKGFNKDAADVNNDNRVNAADIVLINTIINKK